MSEVSLKQSGVRWLWLALLVFALLISTNSLSWTTWVMVGQISCWSCHSSFLYVHNYGAAFSFLSDQSGWQRWLFTGIAFAVTGMLTYWTDNHRRQKSGITLLMRSSLVAR